MAENQLPIQITVEVDQAQVGRSFGDIKKKAEEAGRSIGQSLGRYTDVSSMSSGVMARERALDKAINAERLFQKTLANTSSAVEKLNKTLGAGNKNLMSAMMAGSDDATRRMGVLISQAQEMNKQVDRQNGYWYGVGKRMEKVALLTTQITRALFGLTAITATVGLPAVISTKYLSTIEDAKLGIAGTLQAISEASGASNDWNASMQMSNQVITQLTNSAVKYNISLEEISDTFRGIVGVGMAAGMTLEQVGRIATIGTMAVKSLNLSRQQTLQEIRDLAQPGGIQAASSTLATALNITNEMTKKWKEAGTLFENLEKRMAGYTMAAIERQNTLSGAFDILQIKLQRLFADPKGFEVFKNVIKDISNAIGEVNYETGEIKFNPELVGMMKSYWEQISNVAKAIGMVAEITIKILPKLWEVATVFGVWYTSAKVLPLIYTGLVAISGAVTALPALFGSASAAMMTLGVTASAVSSRVMMLTAGAAGGIIGLALFGTYTILDMVGAVDQIFSSAESRAKAFRDKIKGYDVEQLQYRKMRIQASIEYIESEQKDSVLPKRYDIDGVKMFASSALEQLRSNLRETEYQTKRTIDANEKLAANSIIQQGNLAEAASKDLEAKKDDTIKRANEIAAANRRLSETLSGIGTYLQVKGIKEGTPEYEEQQKRMLSATERYNREIKDANEIGAKKQQKEAKDHYAVLLAQYKDFDQQLQAAVAEGSISFVGEYNQRLEKISALQKSLTTSGLGGNDAARKQAELNKLSAKANEDYVKNIKKMKDDVTAIYIDMFGDTLSEADKYMLEFNSKFDKTYKELVNALGDARGAEQIKIISDALDRLLKTKDFAPLVAGIKDFKAAVDSLVESFDAQRDAIELSVIKSGGTALDEYNGKLKSQQLVSEQINQLQQMRNKLEQDFSGVEKTKAYSDEAKRLDGLLRGLTKTQAQLKNETDQTFGAGAERAVKNYYSQLKNVAADSEQLFTKAFKSIEDALVDAFMGAKVDIKAIFKSLLADIVRMFVRQQIMVPIVGVFQGTQGSPQGATGTAGGGGIFGGFNSFGGGTFGSSSVTDMIANVATMTGNGAWGAGFANGMSGVSDAIAAYNSAASTAAQAGNAAQAAEFAKAATDLTNGANAAGSTLGQFAKSAGEYLPYLDAGLKLFQGDIKGAATSAAGTYVGMMVGGPIGAVIGSFIGSGLTESIFGGGWENKGSPRIEGSFGGEGFEGYFARTQKKDGGWFRSDKERTERSPIGEELNTALDDAYKSIQSTLINLATNVGDTTAKSIIDSFTYTVKENIDSNNPTEALEKVINNMADSMTRSIVPSFDALVKKGESASDASSRLVGQLIAVKGAAESFANTNFSGTVDQLVVLSNGLVTMMGGLENFNASSQYYYENFYTEEEKLANTAIKVEEVFSSLNLTLPTTKNGFRDIIKSLDLTTASGQFTYAALMKVAPAFVELTKDIDDAAAAAAEQAAQAAQASLLDKYNPMDTVAEAVAAFENEGINIGHVLNMTADQLRNFAANAISAVDPTTEAGQRLLATFQKLAPAFDLIVEKADAMKKIVATMEGTLYNQADPAVAAKNIASRTNLSQSDLLSMTKEELQSTYNSIIGNAVTKIKEIKTTITASDIKSVILGVGDTVIDSIGKGEIESLSEILDTYTNKANEALTKMGVSQETAANIIATAVGIITSMDGTGVPATGINSVIGNAVSGINDIVNTVIVSESESFTDLKSEFDVLISNFDKTTESTKDAADAASDLADRMKELQSSLKQTIQDILSNYGGSNTLTSAFAFNQLESDITSLNGALGTAQITVTNLAKVLMGDLSTATVDQLEMYQNATTSFNNYISAIKTELESANQELDKLKQLRDSYTSFGTKILRDIATANNQSIVPLISSEISKLESAIVSALPEDAITMAEELRGLYQELFNEENRLAEEQKANYERSIEFAKSIRGYLDKLRISEQSPASLEDRLKEAANQFSTTLTKSIAGDAEAQQALTGISDTYLGLAKDYFASTEGYADIFNQVVTGLEGIEGVKSIGELTYDETTEIKANTAEFVKKLEWLNGLMSTNSAKVDTQITTAQQQVTYLQGIFDALGANGAIVQAINSLLANYGTKAQELAVTVSYNGTSHKVSGGSKEDLVLAAVSSINPGFDYAGAAASNPALIEAWGKDLGIPGYAKGGMANGWSIVGERGPEVVNFAQPTRVYTNEQTQGMFAPVAANENDEEYLKAVIAELQALIRQNGAGTQAVIEELQQVKAELEEIRSKTRMKDAA